MAETICSALSASGQCLRGGHSPYIDLIMRMRSPRCGKVEHSRPRRCLAKLFSGKLGGVAQLVRTAES